VTGHETSVPADTLYVMAAAVRADRQGTGLAGKTLTVLRERATSAGLRRVIAPVRPTLKSRYPLTPMENFAHRTRGDGLHLDPWIRTYQRLGASILTPAPRSMTITGTVADWEHWAGMAFPESGQYVVADALDLVAIDRDQDRGTGLGRRHGQETEFPLTQLRAQVHQNIAVHGQRGNGPVRGDR
jgi:hypothetical protein